MTSKWFDKLIIAVGCLFFLYQMASLHYPVLAGESHQNAHLALGLLMVFLVGMKKSKRLAVICGILLLFSLVGTAYVHVVHDDLVDRAWFPTVPDVIISLLVLVAIFEATRRSFGLVLPVIALIFLLYALFGHYLPQPFKALEWPIEKTISALVTGFSGVYGTILNVSANYLCLFFFFAALLQGLGGVKFFQEIGKLIARRVRSGAAMAAVVTSCAVGSITGTAGPNVAITGSFTIPAMKRVGYKPEQAGGIEAAASTGGQYMPPVMGVAAFVMVAYTNIPYIAICAACLMPALLYYLSCGTYAHLNALKRGITPEAEEVNVRELLLSMPLFVGPLLVLVVLLVQGMPPGYAVFWAILCTIGIGLLRKENRISFSKWLDIIKQGAMTAGTVTVTCALLGILVATVIQTGLPVKLPSAITEFTAGNFYLMLVMTAMVSILLGCGLPSIAVYVLVAVLIAPMLIDLGLSLLQAHLFAFYYGVLSAVTIPVAVGSLIAASLAGSSYFKTAVESMKVVGAGFLIPFFFIWVPALLLKPEGWAWAIIGIIVCAVIIVVTQVIFSNWLITGLKWWERAGALAAVIAFFACLITQSYLYLGVGVALIALLVFSQLNTRKTLATQTASGNDLLAG